MSIDNEPQIDEDEEDFEVITQSDEELRREREKISRLGLDKESDKAFSILYNKNEQKEYKIEKKPPPEFFIQ